MVTTALATVLIVDDEAAQRAALSNALRRQGYAPIGASSGEEALRILHTERIDLLLTDLKMPDMDGIELLRRALTIDATLVGVLMTGHGTIATAVEAMRVGALDFILKPFKLSAVLPVLSRALAVRELRIENAELQARIHQRTAELEAANKELDAFAHSVSHDLRGPLRAVTGFASILIEDHQEAMTPAVRELVRKIDRAGRHGVELFEALLRFSRLGREPMSTGLVSVASLVQDVLATLQCDVGTRHIDVSVGDLPDVTADPSLLRQVFENLLSNAFKFTQGRDRARVEVGCQMIDGARVIFVRDNGAGFDMQHANRLFGVFQRLHSQEQFSGTGVGLSLVQRIVHRHGGRIWAEGAIDKGATFFFTLG